VTSEVVCLTKCGTAIICMLVLHNIQHSCSYDHFRSGTGLFHSENRCRTAVPVQCSGQNPSIALVLSSHVTSHNQGPVPKVLGQWDRGIDGDGTAAIANSNRLAQLRRHTPTS
jgi:hypothetical protein